MKSLSRLTSAVVAAALLAASTFGDAADVRCAWPPGVMTIMTCVTAQQAARAATR